MEDVLQQAPESDKIRYYLGAIYEEVGRNELALLHYKKIPPTSTYYADAIVHSAHLLKTTGAMDKALELVAGAIKAQDEIPQLYAYYATLLDETKEFKKAVAMPERSREQIARQYAIAFFLGTMQDRLGNSKETIAQMNKVLEQDKDHVQALNYLAYTYAELGNHLDDATRLASHALELQPNDGYILDTIGWIHFKKGETDEAIKYLEAALKVKSDESIIAEHLGDAYLRHQMWQKAKLMYQRAAWNSSKTRTTRAKSRINSRICRIRSNNPRVVPPTLQDAD